MRKAIFAICLTLISIITFADRPEDWYKPSEKDYKRPQKLDAVANVTDARGALHEVNFSLQVGADGYVTESSLKSALSDIKLSLNSAVDLVDLALSEVANNALDISRLDAQFVALGENLHKVFSVDGMSIMTGGKTFRLKIRPGSLKNAIMTDSEVEYDDTDGLFLVADDLTLTQVERNGIRMLGWKTVPTADPSVAYKLKDGSIAWRPVADLVGTLGVDGVTITTNRSGKLELKGWNGKGNECNTSLSTMLTEDANTDRANHFVLTRYNDGGENKFHYVPLGPRIKPVEPDNVSITEKEENGAIATNTASLFGYDFADTGALPIKGHENLEWRTLDDIVDNKTICTVDALIPDAAEKKLEIKGAKALEESMARNMYLGTSSSGGHVGWHSLPVGVKFVGTDGSEATATNTVTFASADDSNVKVTVEDNGNGNITLRFGVYYK